MSGDCGYGFFPSLLIQSCRDFFWVGIFSLVSVWGRAPRVLFSQLLGLRSEAKPTRGLPSVCPPLPLSGLCWHSQEQGWREWISPNSVNKRQLDFKRLLDNVKKRSQMFVEPMLKWVCPEVPCHGLSLIPPLNPGSNVGR